MGKYLGRASLGDWEGRQEGRGGRARTGVSRGGCAGRDRQTKPLSLRVCLFPPNTSP
jgi:hypothetical protein